MAHPPTSTRHPNNQTAAASASHGSQTITQTPTNPFADLPSGTLRLRGHPEEAPTASSSGRRIQWAEDVIDNEGMGKKSSKVCCIYHKPKEPGDSESESDTSGSDTDSDSEPDLSRAQRAGGGKKGGRGHGHGHGQDRDDDGGDHASSGSGKGKGKGKVTARSSSPNAYERQPKPKSKKAG